MILQLLVDVNVELQRYSLLEEEVYKDEIGAM